MRPVSGRLAETPNKPEEPAEPGRCTMPTPPPRHLARPRRPWRLLLFVFGLTTAALAALVASATLLPQPEPPPGPRRRAAYNANQASPDVCVDHHHCSPGADHHASSFHHT